MTKIRAEIQRSEGTVFVSVSNPNQVFPAIGHQHTNWAHIASDIAETDISQIPEPTTPENDTPLIDEIFAESLPVFIEASRWGRYIVPGPASRIFDNTTFCYHNPCDNFWNLYELSKGIFRDLGICLKKQSGVWVANIPIRVLTDKVFIESGLAGVEKTLLEHTGIDPVAILDEIRDRQFKETQDGIRNVKLNNARLRDVVGDAVGAIVLFAVSYFGFVVGGIP